MKELYIVATAQPEALDLSLLEDAFSESEVTFRKDVEGLLFSLQASETRIDVRFESRDEGLGWTPDLITGTEKARSQLKYARGFYRISIEPGKPQPTVAVFEALWCIRAILEQLEGVVLDVSAFKLHERNDVEEITELEFDIRDHVTLHAVEATQTETPFWVHSHGMEKFGVKNIEIFHLADEDLSAAETFVNELCTDFAFGHGPTQRSSVETSTGNVFELVPSEDARLNLLGVSSDVFDGHEAKFLTVVTSGGRHNIIEILKPYREQFKRESEEESRAFKEEARILLPTFKARFSRRGFMEPLSFLVRAGFESHPKGSTVVENLWIEVLAWDEDKLIGKIVDGGIHTSEWRRGAQVEIEESDINALSLSREGRPLDSEEMRGMLFAERPS